MKPSVYIPFDGHKDFDIEKYTDCVHTLHGHDMNIMNGIFIEYYIIEYL